MIFIFMGEKYEIMQPEWLLLLIVYLFFVMLSPRIKLIYFKYADSASLANLTTNNIILFHPFVHLLKNNLYKKKSKVSFHIFHALILSLLLFALTQPVKIGQKLPDPPLERDIVFIVDTSVSMILRDYILDDQRIDRMSLLKSILSKFIHKLNGERMSIIVFGDNAYTLVPLTSDQYLLQQMLARIQVTMAGRFNAIGDAIALAVKQAEENINEGNNRKRILVLLTDADQPTGKIEPFIAAQLAKDNKLPLYTIAIGATNKKAEEKRQGGLLYSPVNLDLVNSISKITGAKSYQAGDPNALENAIQNITQHETNKRIIKPSFYREALYHYFIVLAIILFSAHQIHKLFFPLVNMKKNNIHTPEKGVDQ